MSWVGESAASALEAGAPSQSTAASVSRAETRPRPDPNASRRRDKRQLSCSLCRRRKLRCNRQQPCSNCSSRGLTCTYTEHPTTPLVKQAAIHDRIVHLERLVMSLIPRSTLGSVPGQTQESTCSPAPNLRRSPSPGVASAIITPAQTTQSAEDTIMSMDVHSECGSMRVDRSELSYVGGDHWAAILDGIADLKEHFEREEGFQLAEHNHDTVGSTGTDNLPRPRRSHTLLLYGCPPPASHSEILAALPPKSASDRYVSRYFNRLDLVHSIVHGPTFLREYEMFWADPPSVPIMWVGLLFSMICLALRASDASDTAHGDPEHQSLQIDLYREKTVQCLVMGEYTKGGPYTLETLVHYVYIETSLRGDADKDVWFLFALEVNLAMRMGYHRDPSHFPAISRLQGEMRRRLWATVLQGDILVSAQMGMPRMISDWKCDTAEPRNLSDADLDKDTAELPPPRPETELTPALGIIARRRMFLALGAVADITAAIQSCSYAEVMKVDGVLHDAAANIPPLLKPKAMASSVTDSPDVIIARLFIENLLYLGQLKLHRRFLHAESTSPDKDVFAYSRKTCLTASLGALEIQNVLDVETCRGGQLHMMRWRVSSIMNHTFLTATMVLCSMLHRGQTLLRKDEIVQALRRTRSIWMRAASGSHEAKRAAETVSIVLARAGDGHDARENLPLDISNLGKQPDGVPTHLLCNDGGTDVDVPRQDQWQDNTTLGPTAFDDRLVVPGVPQTLVPQDLEGQTAGFDIFLGGPEIVMALDEWIRINTD